MQTQYRQRSNKLSKSFYNLKYLLLNSISFDFMKHTENQKVLFVGEGNFSFSLEIAENLRKPANVFISTSLEHETAWSEETRNNVNQLQELSALVFHRIDATKIDQIFNGIKLDLIIFQFPNVGSRNPSHGRNPNHILIRKFLKSAKSLISKKGRICITTVNSSYYDGAFSIDDAANWAGFSLPVSYPFISSKFPSYKHFNTLNENECAMTKEDDFITFVFQNKGD